jgi:hypothetical protein
MGKGGRREGRAVVHLVVVETREGWFLLRDVVGLRLVGGGDSALELAWLGLEIPACGSWLC